MDFSEDFGAGSRTVVFAFATCVNDTFGDMPRYEFGRLLHDLRLDHVLFRSPLDEWYQNGVAGIGDIEEVVSYMRRIGANYSRSVSVGTSSGSYAALLFGHLTPTSEVIAISPVTGVGEDAMQDFSPDWHHRLVHDHSRIRIRDLKEVYKAGTAARVQLFVSDGSAAEIDLGMAERLGVGTITKIPGYTHAGLARGMRDQGLLSSLLRG
jgi:hypothetical protein